MIKPLSVSPGAGSEVRFQAYISALSEEIGHADRIDPLRSYCTGLLLPGERKSIEPMPRSAACPGNPPIPASLRRQGPVERHRRSRGGARAGAARADTARPDHRLDPRRHRLSQERKALGRRDAPILRPIGQTGSSIPSFHTIAKVSETTRD